MKKNTAAYHWKRAKQHLRDHFVPHPGNDHRPHLLKHHVLAGYSVILILLKILVIVAPIALPSSSLFSSAITPQNIIDLTNQDRKNVDLPSLKENQLLDEAASQKAADMLANQYFAHTSPSGVTPWDWFKKVGYNYQNAGENLAVHFYQAEDVDAGWMASPSHRANIVNNTYTDIGVGVASGQFEGVSSTFVAQLFGRPATSLAVAAAPATPTKNAPETTVAVGEVAGAHAATTAPAPQKVVSAPTVKESSVVVVPHQSSYQVKAQVDNANEVQASVGESHADLTRLGTSNTWQGTVAYDPKAIAKTGEPLQLTASGENGASQTSTVALVAPGTEAQQFYIFNEGTDRVTQLFGFLHITNFNDSVRTFYIGFIIFLSAALLLSLLFERFHVRHPSVLSHAMAVIIFAVFLTIV